MRFSTLFGRTLREAPSDAEIISHQLSLRAALIRQVAAGIYTYLPLGWRVLRKIEQIMREEMDAVDGQELSMPVAQPAELWRATGRYDAPAPGPALLRFKDRGDHEMVLGMTHEEVVTALAKTEIDSYRQLPLVVYQIQTKFRDEPRSRGGLIRVREFIMKDAYSFHADLESLDAYYPRIYQAYLDIFRRCGVQTIPVEADSGIMGGSASHEFMVLSEMGEDTLVICENCGYAANAEKALFDKGTARNGPAMPVERVATPGTTSIQAVAEYLGVTQRQTLKAVFMSDPQGKVIFAVIRGDLEVNPTKLSNALGGVELHTSTAEELQQAGIVAGYASPIGVTGVRVVADDSVICGTNFVAGANEAGYHLRNVNYPRDFSAELVTDIALARSGDPCAQCGEPVQAKRGIEAGHVFKLGTKYSAKVGATFLDKNGAAQPLIMGSYGIGTGRLLACIIEQNHDVRGIIWPKTVTPFHVHMVSLGTNNPVVVDAADALYQQLVRAGYEVLYDDRSESAGVKFNDADLIGIPVRITISKRTLEQGSVEYKQRSSDTVELVSQAMLEQRLAQFYA
ncbi:MAG: proline--tRNA ligase [Anaerolineae bacterium]